MLNEKFTNYQKKQRFEFFCTCFFFSKTTIFFMTRDVYSIIKKADDIKMQRLEEGLFSGLKSMVGSIFNKIAPNFSKTVKDIGKSFSSGYEKGNIEKYRQGLVSLLNPIVAVIDGLIQNAGQYNESGDFEYKAGFLRLVESQQDDIKTLAESKNNILRPILQKIQNPQSFVTLSTQEINTLIDFLNNSVKLFQNLGVNTGEGNNQEVGLDIPKVVEALNNFSVNVVPQMINDPIVKQAANQQVQGQQAQVLSQQEQGNLLNTSQENVPVKTTVGMVITPSDLIQEKASPEAIQQMTDFYKVGLNALKNNEVMKRLQMVINNGSDDVVKEIFNEFLGLFKGRVQNLPFMD